MSEDRSSQANPQEQLPRALVQVKQGFSVIWVVPIIALLIGGWLAYKAASEKGPTITITFASADGLEADKTLIKFKDVEIGKVVRIELLSDLSGVIVTAEMHRDAEHYLTENTRFWVIRARVAAGEVSGLGTLFSGVYIGCSPSLEGQERYDFKGLEAPPVLTEGLPGRHFILEAKNLGSLDIGSPVYYRGIKVGQVVKYDFDDLAESVLVRVFIDAPYHEKVRQNTRFWNASGVDITLDVTGVKLDTQSLATIMLGGVAFDVRHHDPPQAAAEDNRIFPLYNDQSSSSEDVYSVKRYYRMYFDESVRGLKPGAPVEIRGIQIGEVVRVELQYDLNKADFRVPVLMVIEPERLGSFVKRGGEVASTFGKSERFETTTDPRRMDRVNQLIARGLRAQLKTGNMLTGQLFVDLDFYPDSKPAQLETEGEYLVFPSLPAPLPIAQRVDTLLKMIQQVPFDKIGRDLHETIAGASATLKEIRGLSAQLSETSVPKLNEALDSLQKSMKGLQSLMGSGSPLSYNVEQIASELALAVRSLHSLLTTLERDPQVLLLGKEDEER